MCERQREREIPKTKSSDGEKSSPNTPVVIRRNQRGIEFKLRPHNKESSQIRGFVKETTIWGSSGTYGRHFWVIFAIESRNLGVHWVLQKSGITWTWDWEERENRGRRKMKLG